MVSFDLLGEDRPRELGGEGVERARRTFWMALERVGFGPVCLAPKRRFMVVGEFGGVCWRGCVSRCFEATLSSSMPGGLPSPLRWALKLGSFRPISCYTLYPSLSMASEC